MMLVDVLGVLLGIVLMAVMFFTIRPLFNLDKEEFVKLFGWPRRLRTARAYKGRHAAPADPLIVELVDAFDGLAWGNWFSRRRRADRAGL